MPGFPDLPSWFFVALGGFETASDRLYRVTFAFNSVVPSDTIPIMAQQLSDLQSFSIPNTLVFEEGVGGLIRAAIITPHAEATVYLYGAHVTHYRPTGQRPVLFMSAKSYFEPGKPIRGGVPLCFPWFGPKSGDASAPMHGFGRLMPWTVESAGLLPDKSVSLVLRLESSEATRRYWPVDFVARHKVTVGQTLTMALEVENKSAQPIQFEEAQHTYFSIGDIRNTSVAGLAGVTYIDKLDGAKRKTQDAEPIRFTGETDRPCLNTPATCIITDPASGRRINVEKTGSNTTVVWNPWIAKAKAMADFGDDEWPIMLCVETANALENAVTVAPGQTHEMQTRVISEPA